MKGELLFHMNSGTGEMSYAKNSSFHRKAILNVKPILEETLTRLHCNYSPKCMKVVDLGCSAGPNTLLVISNIIDILHNASIRSTFQFYLNDLFGNDFNTIFKSLPEFYKRLEEEKGHKFGSCFINATPGSFYGRLFPSNSINFFHSSTSLHWLYQDPLLGFTSEELSLNKGHCHLVSSSPPAVHEAYLKKFQKGFKSFLKSRWEELVHGGAMFLFFLGRNETPRRSLWEVISLTLNDMLLEDLIEEAKLESFNIPVYEPTIEEIRHVIQEEGSFFVERLETLIVPWFEGINEGGDESFLDGNTKVEFIAKYTRAGIEPLLSTLFEEKVINEFFIRFQKKLVQLMKVEALEYVYLVISMTKKNI